MHRNPVGGRLLCVLQHMTVDAHSITGSVLLLYAFAAAQLVIYQALYGHWTTSPVPKI